METIYKLYFSPTIKTFLQDNLKDNQARTNLKDV